MCKCVFIVLIATKINYTSAIRCNFVMVCYVKYATRPRATNSTRSSSSVHRNLYRSFSAGIEHMYYVARYDWFSSWLLYNGDGFAKYFMQAVARSFVIKLLVIVKQPQNRRKMPFDEFTHTHNRTATQTVAFPLIVIEHRASRQHSVLHDSDSWMQNATTTTKFEIKIEKLENADEKKNLCSIIE